MTQGTECIQGVRWSYMQVFALALATPPKVGKVEILGSGFRYIPDRTAKSATDSFKLHVLGKNRRDVGASIIEVTVGPSDI